MNEKHQGMEPAHCCSHEPKKKVWYKDLLVWTSAVSAGLLLLSFVLSPLVSFRHALLTYLRLMTLPIAVGFVLGGIIDYYVPKEYISKHLAKPATRTIFYAVGLGFLMSACNHGIIALSMELHKKGASGPAVISFLLASPWANLPITILLLIFFGWKGLIIILSAFLIAITTGLFFQFLDKKGWIEKNRHTVEVDPAFSIRKDIARRWKNYRFTWPGFQKDTAGIAKGVWELADMVLGWVLLGTLLASLSAAYVPEGIFSRFLGPTLLGLAVTLLASTVLEICSEGTSPIAFEIYRQTGALGNAFAFLMGGVVTDYTEIGLVWKNLGRRTAVWMLAVTLPQVFFLGWAFNRIF